MQILVYSKYCKYCLQLINNLEQFPQVGNCLTPLCIDPERKENGSVSISKNFVELQDFLKEKAIPQITKVPTIVLSHETQIAVLSGSDAFNWLDNIAKNFSQEPEEINEKHELQLEGVNPNEMLSFSDSYSMLNSDSVSNQSYQFIGKQLQSIPTIEEQVIDNKEQFCQLKYEELLKERERM